VAEQWFQNSGEAARWLRVQALAHFSKAKFPPEHNQVDVEAEGILDDLYASNISGSVDWIWDAGFFVSVGGRPKGTELHPPRWTHVAGIGHGH
jgi:hypothetical protein